jgi:iron complex transport system substrate-binding protein
MPDCVFMLWKQVGKAIKGIAIFTTLGKSLKPFLGAAAGLFLAVQAGAVQVVDDRGVVVAMVHAPQRIVSLLPSLSETVCALGQCTRLVGVDRYSNFPESLKTLPQMGGGLDPSIEAIVAQRPDLVLLAGSSRVAARLESLGLKVMALEPKTHGDMRQAISKIGQILQVPDAERLWRELESAIDAQAKALPAGVKNAKVFIPVSTSPHSAGEASFIGETLLRLGAQNIVPASMGVFPKLNPEFVVRANPDVIMTSAQNAVGMSQRPGWRQIRAIREKRLCIFTSEQADVLVRPGPRMAQGAQLMAQCLREMAP